MTRYFRVNEPLKTYVGTLQVLSEPPYLNLSALFLHIHHTGHFMDCFGVETSSYFRFDENTLIKFNQYAFVSDFFTQIQDLLESWYGSTIHIPKIYLDVKKRTEELKRELQSFPNDTHSLIVSQRRFISKIKGWIRENKDPEFTNR